MAEYNPSKIIKDGNTYNFRDTTKIPLTGSNEISGSLIPSTDGTVNLGASSKNIKMIYTKGITINGTQFLPSDIPTKTSDLSNDSGFITGVSWNDVSNKPAFAAVATSGSYNDLSNKPTIPTVNNGTLTIQQNGTTVDTFSANSNTDKTVNIQCVDLNSNQTVGGIKTFSNAPVVNSINLDGKSIDTDANGDMTFNGHKVGTIEEQGEGYIRYSDGTQICWGYISPGATVTKNYPKSFSQAPYILASSDTTDSGTIVTTQRTSQAVTAYCNREYYGSSYLAFGRWK